MSLSILLFPRHHLTTISVSATETLKTSIEHASFGEFGFDPEEASARGTFEVVATFHFGVSSKYVLDFGTVDQFVES